MFEKLYKFRDKMPVYHYPMPICEATDDIQNGVHLEDYESIPENNNLYIHIPFCKSLCKFCPYTKWVAGDDKIKKYIDYLFKEIDMYSNKPYIKSMHFNAIYFGGGTPSLLSSKDVIKIISRIKSKFRLEDNAEITIEGSPLSFDIDKFQALKLAGVNRISMGVQTFNEQYSKMLGVPQEPDRACKIIREALSCNFDAVSIDLIYNLPGQKISEWEEDIKKAIELGVNQITLFPLALAPNTVLGNQVFSGKLPRINEQEVEYEFVELASNILKNHGFYQITNVDWISEGSNYKYCENHFSKLGNILGMGVGAFGELNGNSYINTARIDEYYSKLDEKLFPVKKYSETADELIYQYMSMKLRCLKISDDDFSKKFGVSMYKHFKSQIEKLSGMGLIENANGEIRVTDLGSFYLYDISKEFVSPKYSKIDPITSAIENISKG